MYRRDLIDSLLTFCGIVALVALVVKFANFRQQTWNRQTADYVHHWLGHVEGVAGPLDVKGPLTVHGNLYVGGPATVHGLVWAKSKVVGGPVIASLPASEPAGPNPQAYQKSLAVGGPLTVQGSLLVDGRLVVGGPLNSDPE